MRAKGVEDPVEHPFRRLGREVAYTFEGHPVLLGLNTYRGDAYRFEADLYRTRA